MISRFTWAGTMYFHDKFNFGPRVSNILACLKPKNSLVQFMSPLQTTVSKNNSRQNATESYVQK